MIGTRFHRLLVIAPAEPYICPGDTQRHKRWLVRCDCGIAKIVSQSNLRCGNTVSCGCYKRDRMIANNTTHGKADTPEYYSWTGMIQRCFNPKGKAWKDYGGRGITVCPHWMKFENFLADMGDKPAGTSIDRINNDLGYLCPKCHPPTGNCRWATRTEQNNNQRRRRRREILPGLHDAND